VNRQPPFLGTFVNKVDQKGRVSVPAPFRQILGAHSFQGIVCFLSFKVAAIEGCSLDFMSDLSDSVAGIDLFSDTQENLAATIFAESHQLPWDSGGRVQLPADLLESARITDTAAFVGMGKTFRIWEPQALKAFQAESRDKARRGGLSLPLVRQREEG
jgi:MraZ protein